MSIWKNVQRDYCNNLDDATSKFIIEHFKSQRGLTALDIGCYAGKFVYMLSKYGFKVTGIDISLLAILTAKKTYDKFKYFIYLYGWG
jgi:2-polyprenyl-3-methyl-5-hydroxy-6-metoxy-1,4-benzoquinol methylase